MATRSSSSANACHYKAVELGGLLARKQEKIVFVFSRRNDEMGVPQENPKTSFVTSWKERLRIIF